MSVSSLTSSEFEVVKNEYSDRDYDVKISFPEFTCVCPRTGQPDFATIDINYIPDKLIVELKSLKLYIQKFRNLGIFHDMKKNSLLHNHNPQLLPSDNWYGNSKENQQ